MTQPPIPCSDQELLDAINAANTARHQRDAAIETWRQAVARRTAALRSHGVMPGDTE